MNRKWLIFFVLSLFNLCNIFSSGRNSQDLVPVNHWIYSSLRRIMLEQKEVSLCDSGPLSLDEIKCNFSRIDYDKLSESGKKEYERIQSYFSENNVGINIGILSVGVEPSINPEFYFTTDYGKENEKSLPWIYDYTKRQALIDLPLKVSVGDYISLFMGLQAGQSRFALEQNTTFFNDFFGTERFDLVLTHDNYISAGYNFGKGVGINLKYGIFPQVFGQSIMPGVVLSEYLTDTPVFDFRIYSPVFAYDMNVTQFTRESYLYTHRLEAVLFKIFQISFIEGVFANKTFDLRFVNPFSLYHGLGLFKIHDDLRVNSLMAIKGSLTPLENMRIYVLYTQNEHQMSFELNDDNANSIPEGFGIQGGIEYNVPLKGGYLFFGAEGYFASPYLYIKDTPMISFAKVYTENLTSRNPYYQWMGSPLGPDSIGGAFVCGFDNPGQWSVSLKYNFIAKGEKSDSLKASGWDYYSNSDYDSGKWPYDENKNMRAEITPTGIPEYYNIIGICGSWTPLNWLSVSMEPSYIFVNNYLHQKGNDRQSFQFVLSTRIDLNSIIRFNYSIIE